MCKLQTVSLLDSLGCLKALDCLIASHTQSQLHLLVVHPGQPGLAAKVSRRSSGRKLEGLITPSVVFQYVAFICVPQERVFFPFFFALSLSCSFFAFLNSLFFAKSIVFFVAFSLSLVFFAFLNWLFFSSHKKSVNIVVSWSPLAVSNDKSITWKLSVFVGHFPGVGYPSPRLIPDKLLWGSEHLLHPQRGKL